LKLNHWIDAVLPFLPPLRLSSITGSGRGEEPNGENVLRLIQIPLNGVEFVKNPDSLSSKKPLRTDSKNVDRQSLNLLPAQPETCQAVAR
jgi:hypothetical protein